jgi:MFS family permease
MAIVGGEARRLSRALAGARARRQAAERHCEEIVMAKTAPSRHPDAPWLVVVLAAVCTGLHIWDLPAAIPFIRHELPVTLLEAGALLGVTQVAGMLGGLAVALLAELTGERRCLLAGLALASLGSALGAVSVSVPSLLISRMIEGGGSLLVVVTGPGLIRHSTPQHRISTAIGWWGAFTGIATFAGLTASALILQAAPWRLLWWVMTALTLAPVPLVLACVPRDQLRDAAGVVTAARRVAVTVRSLKPWVAGLIFACYTIQWMTVVGFLPTIYAGSGLTGIWPGVLSAVVGGVSAVGSIGTAPLLQRGIPARALLIGGFAAMAATSLLTFAINWASLPAGLIIEVACISAFSLLGGAIPATLFRIAVDLAPPAGSAPAVIGLMQQIFNAGSVVGPAIAAWLVTRTGGWQSTWWMTCTFAALGSLLSLYLGVPHRGIAFGARSADRITTNEWPGRRPRRRRELVRPGSGTVAGQEAPTSRSAASCRPPAPTTSCRPSMTSSPASGSSSPPSRSPSRRA